jgi:hypothetical protein
MTEEEQGTNDPRFEQRLRRLLEGASVPSGTRIADRVDRAVLAMAAAKASQIRRAWWRDRVGRFSRYAAAAAAVLVLLFGLMRQRVVEPDRPVDIVDAYLLARTLASGGPLSEDHDHNGDGRVDAADVDKVARLAVSLEASGTEEGERDV